MKYVVPKELLPLLRSKVTRKEVEEMIASGRYLPIASASALGAIRVGNSLAIDSDGVLSVVGSGLSVEWGNISNKPTTISGYGITDAGISGNTITLGNTSITPLVSFTETDPTVPSWAKQANKPSYAYSEISGTPTNVSTFTNDAGYLTEHQSLDALTPKVQAIPYIVGPDTDTTAGTWTGTYEGITALTDGLTIIYVPHVAGASTTRLNINGLGAFICYYTNTAKITTQYAVGVPILLTYRTVSDVGRWCRADYNSNTTYSAGTKALFDEGTNTSNRVWSASVLAASVAPIEHEHDWSDINNAPAFITADALNGYATEQYVDTEISDLNLGTASQKDYTISVIQGGADLPTSDAVYSAISSAVTSALHYRGMSSTAITDRGTETATIGGQPLTAQSGDIVIYNGLEFLWEEGHWNKLGDDSSYALKTITVTGNDGITGGGDLTANRTLGLSSTTQTNINKGVAAYGWGDHSQAGYLTSFTETDPTVPSWAKASTKPSYDYDEIGNTPFIPTNVSDLTNDAGYISTETDPVFSASAAHGITSSNISSWNSKYSKPSGGIPKTDLASSVQTTLSNADTAYSWGDHAQAGYLTSFTETDPVFSASPSHGITATNITNWNTAFGWGNHASAGYALSADIPTDVSDLNNDAGFITSADIPTNVSAFTNDAGYLTQHQSLDNYYTKSEVDTKTAKTTAIADGKLLYNGQTVDTGLSGLGISTANNLLNSGYHMAIRSNDTNPFFGLKQGANLWYAQAASGYFYFGPTSAKALRLDQNGNGVFQTGSVTATSIIKSGGTSSQFLKADGSVDSNSYLTSFTETDPVFSASDAAGITSSDITNWNAAYSWGNHANAGYLTSVPIATGSVAGGFLYGDPIDTLIVLNNGYLAVDLLGLNSLIESKGYITGYTETDPVFTSSAAHGITSSDITSWNGKYSKPSGGIPKTDFASAVQTSLNKADTALQSFTETDPTVPNWAKQANKPTYTASEVGALPDTTVIPTKTSDLTNDSGFITGYTETDPIFSASAAAGITSSDVSVWNSKQDAISDLSTIRTNAGNGNTAYGWGDHSQAGYLTSYTETDPVFGASAAAGITSGNISTWNAKYSKPSGGIPKSDLASAVQTSLGLADTALQSVPLATDSTIGGFKTGNVNQTYLYFDNDILKVSDSAIADYLSGEGYFDLPTWQDIQNTPTTLSGYGITDAKITNGTITLGSNSITPLTSFTETDPVFSASDAAGITAADVSNWDEAYGWGNHAEAGYLTSFTETDPTVPSWAKSSSKPTYTLDEVADGSIRKLSNYLPLSGGTITGDLTVDQHISANSISLNEFFVGDLINEVADDLGSSGYPWGGVYANNFYGDIDWSYVQNKPTIPTKTSDLTNDSLVSSVKINGDNYTPSSGAVDLGFQGYGELIMGTHTATTHLWTGVSKLPSASAFVSGYRFTYFAPYTGTSDGDTLTLTFQDNSTITVDLYYKATTRLSTHFGAGAKIDFIYLVNANIGGTTRTGCWPHSTYYSDTTNARGLQSYYERGRLYSASAPLYRYKICGYRDGKIVPTTITNQSSATQVNKVPTSIAMDASRGLVYYSTTTAITTANAAIAAQTLHESYNMQTGMYNFNETVPAYCDVYFRGIYDYSTGLFTLDTSQTNSNYRSYYAFAPKASGNYYSDFETGYFYWFVGCAYSTADYIQMKSEHPLYYFNGTQLISVDLNIIQMISSEIPENVSDLNNDAGYVTDGYVDTEITDYAQKKITISSSEPTSSQGQNGDIWLVI